MILTTHLLRDDARASIRGQDPQKRVPRDEEKMVPGDCRKGVTPPRA